MRPFDRQAVKFMLDYMYQTDSAVQSSQRANPAVPWSDDLLTGPSFTGKPQENEAFALCVLGGATWAPVGNFDHHYESS